MRPLVLTLFCLFVFMFVGQFNMGDCATPDPKCSLPVEPGPCRMKLPRFYYNQQTKTCQEFTYGGCRGNENRFGVQSACISACKPVEKK